MNEKRYRRLAVCKRFSVITNFVIGRMVLAGLICLPHLALLMIV